MANKYIVVHAARTFCDGNEKVISARATHIKEVSAAFACFYLLGVHNFLLLTIVLIIKSHCFIFLMKKYSLAEA